MFERAYRKRLTEDLPKWQSAGWLAPEGAAAILGSLPPVRAAFSLASTVAMLGGLLVGLGVIAFISANWTEMPRLARFALLAAGIALAYIAAAALERRKLRIFAEVALLIAALVFAASIALVGQSYHLDGEFTDAIALWLVGTFVAAALTASPTLAAVGLLGGAYWTWAMTFDRDVAPHWAGLLPVLAGAAIGTFAESPNTRRLSVAALIFWAALAIASGGRENHWSWAGGIAFAVSCAIALFGVGALLATLRQTRVAGLGNDIPWPALAAIVVALGLLQAAEHPSSHEPMLLMMTVAALAIGAASAALAAARRWLAWTDVAALAALGILAVLFALNVPVADLWSRLLGAALVAMAALWAISLGQSGTIPQAKTLGLVALGAEVIYLYVRTFGTLMDTALAFLMGGVLFIVLAWALYRLDRYLAARSRPAAAAVTPS